MMNAEKLKKCFIVLVFIQLLLAHVGFAYAADTGNAQAQYDYRNSGVEQQIKTYLCTPTLDQPTDPGTADHPVANNDLFLCINKLYRFAVAAGSAVGVFFIVLAGYIRMTSDGNQESVDKSKSIFASTITAMVILFGGYVLLKALNPDLLRFESIQPPNFNIQQVSVPPVSTGGAPAAGGACTPTTQDLCVAPTVISACQSSTCSSMQANIQQAIRLGSISIKGVNNTAAYVQAIMAKESSCQSNQISTHGACGLMQLLPETANLYKNKCGVTDTITCNWLTDSKNAVKSICIGAAYLQSLSNGACSSSVQDTTAGYNGGGGACKASVNCAGATSCAGGTMKGWECLYSSNDHSTCDQGYYETRNYVPLVVACYNALK